MIGIIIGAFIVFFIGWSVGLRESSRTFVKTHICCEEPESWTDNPVKSFTWTKQHDLLNVGKYYVHKKTGTQHIIGDEKTLCGMLDIEEREDYKIVQHGRYNHKACKGCIKVKKGKVNEG